MGKQRFVVLDGLRGIAAIAVLLYHFGQMTNLTVFPNGGLAVDFFFILSGFVISEAYGDKLGSSLSFRAFAARRVLRLYPMVIVGASLGLATIVLGLDTGLRNRTLSAAEETTAFVFGVLLLPHSPFPDWTWTRWPINPPYWSLFFEVIINLVFALFGFRLSSKALTAVAAVSFAALAAISLGDTPKFLLVGSGLRTLLGFTIGVLLHRAHAAGMESKFQVPAVMPFALVVALLWGPTGENGVYSLLAVPVLAAVVAFCRSTAQGEAQEKVCTALGDLSYPLYAIHFPILWILVSIVPVTDLTGARLFSFVILLVVGTSALAFGLAKYFDEPFRRVVGQAAVVRRMTA